jgi:hypothetical protein
MRSRSFLYHSNRCTGRWEEKGKHMVSKFFSARYYINIKEDNTEHSCSFGTG